MTITDLIPTWETLTLRQRWEHATDGHTAAVDAVTAIGTDEGREQAQECADVLYDAALWCSMQHRAYARSAWWDGVGR